MKTSVVTVTLNPALDKTVTVSSLKTGGLNRVKDIRMDAGGKGINVAKVLKKFEVDVLAAGLIAGFQGQLLLEYLEAEGIKTSFLKIPGETRTNLKIVEEKTKITTEVNEAGFLVTQEDLKRFSDNLLHLMDQTCILVLSGSLPPGVPETIYKDYIEIANAKGIKTILDADGKALEEGIKALPFAIKPNIHELENLAGCKLLEEKDVVLAGRHLIEKGINLVVISMGSEGAIVLNDKETYRVKTFPIKRESTVGAGDSMVATLAYALLNNKPLEEIAKWITTAGTITASKPGTQVCTLAEVQQSLHQVHAFKI
ncbi:MAG: 1-phosphofructokinase [Clostridia bacterium]|jgi:1-phosphofructokinase|uniref:1-phosphofructokinase n=1 Tax=Petroclostridium xylanilyticum TaxID=1792311 RepID=UPI000B98B8CA|nr:1-phosphofructokinase [Petroclostridium xylanilyticum]MBZ4646434.1 1-phosphofructokinase [Clostridia bacterium]